MKTALLLALTTFVSACFVPKSTLKMKVVESWNDDKPVPGSEGEFALAVSSSDAKVEVIASQARKCRRERTEVFEGTRHHHIGLGMPLADDVDGRHLSGFAGLATLVVVLALPISLPVSGLVSWRIVSQRNKNERPTRTNQVTTLANVECPLPKVVPSRSSFRLELPAPSRPTRKERCR